jgi:hypothetical protein
MISRLIARAIARSASVRARVALRVVAGGGASSARCRAASDAVVVKIPRPS